MSTLNDVVSWGIQAGAFLVVGLWFAIWPAHLARLLRWLTGGVRVSDRTKGILSTATRGTVEQGVRRSGIWLLAINLLNFAGFFFHLTRLLATG